MDLTSPSHRRTTVDELLGTVPAHARPLVRPLAEAIVATGDPVDVDWFTKAADDLGSGRFDFRTAVTPQVRERYERAFELFEAFCRHQGLPGPDQLTDTDLQAVAEVFLQWLATDVDADHELVTADVPTRGRRHQTAPIKKLDTHRAALAEWGIDHGRVVLTDAARAIRSPRAGERPRRSAVFTVDHLVAAIDAYDTRTVADIGDGTRSELWHLRERAALLVSVWGALRVGERAKLEDRLIVPPDPGDRPGITIRLPRTKAHPDGRTIFLPERGDRLCAVTALTEYHQATAAAGLDRGGLLLPTVPLAGDELRRPVYGTERANLRRMLVAIGSAHPDWDVDDLLANYRLHGLRAVLANAAHHAGWSPEARRRLGGWDSQDAADSYLRPADTPRWPFPPPGGSHGR